MKRLHPIATLGFTLAAVTLSGLPSAHAQSVNPSPAPTIITSAPYTISTPGYYQLGANLSYAGTGATNDAIITVNASNVTLDFAGHYISGPSGTAATNLFGVYAYERSNLIIQNGTIAYCEYGVRTYGNGNTTTTNFLNPRVLNMTVTKCYYVGISLQEAVSPIVSDCHVSSIGGSSVYTGGYGIEIYGATGGKASNNTVTEVAAQGSSFAYGINGGASTLVSTGNEISSVTSPSGSAYGLDGGTLALGNTIISCQTGISGYVKYSGNLTSGCTTAFSGGTNVGNENN